MLIPINNNNNNNNNVNVNGNANEEREENEEEEAEEEQEEVEEEGDDMGKEESKLNTQEEELEEEVEKEGAENNDDDDEDMEVEVEFKEEGSGIIINGVGDDEDDNDTEITVSRSGHKSDSRSLTKGKRYYRIVTRQVKRYDIKCELFVEVAQQTELTEYQMDRLNTYAMCFGNELNRIIHDKCNRTAKVINIPLHLMWTRDQVRLFFFPPPSLSPLFLPSFQTNQKMTKNGNQFRVYTCEYKFNGRKFERIDYYLPRCDMPEGMSQKSDRVGVSYPPQQQRDDNGSRHEKAGGGEQDHETNKDDSFVKSHDCPDVIYRNGYEYHYIGCTCYENFFTDEELKAIENCCDQLSCKQNNCQSNANSNSNSNSNSNGSPTKESFQLQCEQTAQHTSRHKDKTIIDRTKYFFNSRYLWTKQDLQDLNASVANGIRVDVDKAPTFFYNLVEKPLLELTANDK
ncbi:hypothetical protein RFI_25606 [Reticulomyxa filosa]|uniref:Uncharacterized protein n=1 Tax=Reticulomyxa filosa TaxID=46433 RepID=X6MCZ7_RETFI|nr:hypothetical protein RFI_25606 [Reticulomyxa filosa]|eukprot:ETO11769.1 hypothetical protein RFI_25606 [Reticulomyxa filosa]